MNKHPLKVGDLLKSVWGYDQTNVDYYQVVALNGATMVTIRPIAARQTTSPSNSMVGTCTPVKGDFTGSPRRCRPGSSGDIKLTSYSWARPCSDDDCSRWSSYA